MFLNITYKEIIDFVEENYKVKISIEKIDSKSIKLSGKLAVLIPAVNVKLRLDDSDVNSIFIYYESRAIATVFKFIETIYSCNIADLVKIDSSNKRFIFDKHVETEKVSLDISNIEFDDSSVKITATNFALS